jgi:general secretion pathway protein E
VQWPPMRPETCRQTLARVTPLVAMVPLPLSPVALESLAWWAGAWLLLVVGWAAVSLWVSEDARVVFGSARRWRIVFMAVGVLGLLATAVFGRTAFTPTLLPLSAAALVYIARREMVATPDQKLPLRRWIEERLGRGVGGPIGRTGARPIVLLKKDGQPYEGSDSETSRAVQAAKATILEAVDLGATDIHFVPRSGGRFDIRCRIDGLLRKTGTFPAGEGRTVLSVLKVLGDMDIAERRRPQEGTFAFRVDGRGFDVRSHASPTADGEKLALRLLEAANTRSLEELGMRSKDAATVRDICRRSSGTVLICGPTGEGKTTTAFAALAEIDGVTRNIVTIEDPIEYRLEVASQIPVNEAAGQTFPTLLRSVLRQDPDVILVGEIRDQETAEIAMRAALTGHLVFSTIHAKDTATAITRLVDMGIDASLLQSALSVIIAQRLVKLLCRKCRRPFEPSAEQRRRYSLPAERVSMLHEAVGCEGCGDTGYAGRTSVQEVMLVDQRIRELLVGRPSVETIRRTALAAGTRSLQRSALKLAVEGRTSLTEVDRLAD